MQVHGSWARGHVVKRDIVHVGIPRADRAIGLDGHVAARTLIDGEVCLVFHPGRAFHLDSCHLGEGVDVGGVGHHAYLEHRMVAGRCRLGPELLHHHRIRG